MRLDPVVESELAHSEEELRLILDESAKASKISKVSQEIVANAFEMRRRLDPRQAPAQELASVYGQSWELENALDELKTHLRGPRVVLRSKTPELVFQEFYGLLLAHFCVRSLMHEAAHKAREDPDQLSFTHCVQVIRRKLPPDTFSRLNPHLH